MRYVPRPVSWGHEILKRSADIKRIKKWMHPKRKDHQAASSIHEARTAYLLDIIMLINIFWWKRFHGGSRTLHCKNGSTVPPWCQGVSLGVPVEFQTWLVRHHRFRFEVIYDHKNTFKLIFNGLWDQQNIILLLLICLNNLKIGEWVAIIQLVTFWFWLL